MKKLILIDEEYGFRRWIAVVESVHAAREAFRKERRTAPGGMLSVRRAFPNATQVRDGEDISAKTFVALVHMHERRDSSFAEVKPD